MRATHLVAILAISTLGACALVKHDKPLHDLRTNKSEPEEFAIVPNKPLLDPESYAQLPAPTPGAANRADQTPKSDAVAVLGGNPARLAPGQGVPSGDVALINRVSRFGRDPNVRATLAASDAEFRRKKNIFNFKLLPEDRYKRAYRAQALDPYQWLNRYRRAGARTPTAPPR